MSCQNQNKPVTREEKLLKRISGLKNYRAFKSAVDNYNDASLKTRDANLHEGKVFEQLSEASYKFIKANKLLRGLNVAYRKKGERELSLPINDRVHPIRAIIEVARMDYGLNHFSRRLEKSFSVHVDDNDVHICGTPDALAECGFVITKAYMTELKADLKKHKKEIRKLERRIAALKTAGRK
jgi:hypothetical protein